MCFERVSTVEVLIVSIYNPSLLNCKIWERDIWMTITIHTFKKKKSPESIYLFLLSSLTSQFYHEFIKGLWSWQCFLIDVPWQFEPLSKHCVCWNILSFFTPRQLLFCQNPVSKVIAFSFCLRHRDKSQLVPLGNINNWIGQSRLRRRPPVQMQ